MKKKTKRQINSGNSFKFGTKKHRSYECSFIAKFTRNEASRGRIDLLDEKAALYEAIDEHVDDGGLLSGIRSHQRASVTGNNFSFYRITKDEDMAYSLKKRKRWEIVPNLREKIRNIRMDEADSGVAAGSYAPKCIVSLVEGEWPGGVTYGRTRQTWCTDYHDSQVGHVTSKHAYSTPCSLRSKGEEKVKKEKGETSVKKTKAPPGHNQHFRAIQRKAQMQRKRKMDDAQTNSRSDAVAALPEVRYAVITECPKNSHRMNYVDKYERSVCRRNWNLQGTKALCKGKGQQKAGDLDLPVRGPALTEEQLLIEMTNGFDDACAEDSGNEDYFDVLEGEDVLAKPSTVLDITQLVDKAFASKLQKSDGVVGRKCACRKKRSCVTEVNGNDVKKNCVVYVDSDTVSAIQTNPESEEPNTNSFPKEAPLVDHFATYFDTVPTSYTIPFHSDSIRPKLLEHEFSDAYSEGCCLPRKFMVAVNVRRQETTEQPHVVFECVGEDRSLDCLAVDEWEDLLVCDSQRFSVRVEGHLGEEERASCDAFMAQCQDDVTTPTALVANLAMLLQKNSESTPCSGDLVGRRVREDRTPCKFKATQHLLKWETDVFSIEEARRQVQHEPPGLFNKKPHVKNPLPVVQFDAADRKHVCDICFEKILFDEEGAKGAALLPCQHWFCRDCWRHHLLSRVRQGDLSLKCPGYECDHVLDHVTLLSLVSQTLYDKHWKHVQDTKIDRSAQWQWCPNRRCGRLVRACVDGKDPPGSSVCVDCLCNKVWCFDCQREAHWPASCQAYESYIQAVTEQSKRKREAEVTYVKVKKCPKCKYPINKNGGCQHMVCKCGCSFCWECVTPWAEHTANWLMCVRGKVEETAIHLDEERLLRINEYTQSLAIEFRELRLKCDVGNHKTTFKRLVFKQHLSCSKHKPSKHVVLLDKFIADHLREEERKFFDICAFLYEAYHILEYSLAATSHFPRKTCQKLLRKIQDLTLIVTALQQMLTVNRSSTNMKEYIESLQKLVGGGKLLIDVIPQKVLRVQEKLTP